MDDIINHEFDSNPLSPVAETCDHESPTKPSARVVIKMYPGSILGLSSPSQRVADDATNLTLSQTKSILVSNGQFHGFLRVDRKKWPDGICRDPSIQFVDAEPPSAYVGNPDLDTIDNASKFVSLFLFLIFTLQSSVNSFSFHFGSAQEASFIQRMTNVLRPSYWLSSKPVATATGIDPNKTAELQDEQQDDVENPGDCAEVSQEEVTTDVDPKTETTAVTTCFSFETNPDTETTADTTGFSVETNPETGTTAATTGFSFEINPETGTAAATTGFSIETNPESETAEPTGGLRRRPAVELGIGSAFKNVQLGWNCQLCSTVMAPKAYRYVLLFLLLFGENEAFINFRHFCFVPLFAELMNIRMIAALSLRRGWCTRKIRFGIATPVRCARVVVVKGFLRTSLMLYWSSSIRIISLPG
jgi:hypothetical protein